MPRKDQHTSENALDRFNRRGQRQLVPEAAGMSGVFQNSDSEEEEEGNNLTIASKITTRDIRSRLKPFIKKEDRPHIKYIKYWILQKRDEGKAVWPPEIMKYLLDSFGISSISDPVNYYDIVNKIFLMIFCLIKKIPLHRGCPPGNTCQWIRDLTPEDRDIVSRYHNVHTGRAGRNSTQSSRPTGTTFSTGWKTTSNVSTSRNKRKISDLNVKNSAGVSFQESVESVNRSVQRPRCHPNGLGLDFSIIGEQKKRMKESLRRLARGEDISRQEAAEECKKKPTTNQGGWGRRLGLSDSSQEGKRIGWATTNQGGWGKRLGFSDSSLEGKRTGWAEVSGSSDNNQEEGKRTGSDNNAQNRGVWGKKSGSSDNNKVGLGEKSESSSRVSSSTPVPRESTSATSDPQESTVVSPEKKKKKMSLVSELVSTDASFARRLDVKSTSTELPNFAPESFSIENVPKNVVDQQIDEKIRKFSSEDEKLQLCTNVEEEQKEEVNVQCNLEEEQKEEVNVQK
jgi:hypothetical protein